MGTKQFRYAQSDEHMKMHWQEHGPGIKRAYTYKSLNKLIQGSAADMTKKSMLDLYKEGIVAHIQIHDEFVYQ